MDAATATVIAACIAAFSAITVAIISSRNAKTTKTKCEEHQRQLAEQYKQSFSDPANHYFFGKMQHYLTTLIPALRPSDGIPKIKMEMVQKFLEIKFKVFYDGMRKWVADPSEIKLTETAKYICELIREYETTALARGIPDIFIKSFTVRHEAVVISTIESLEQIMRSTSYSQNDKENAVLDVLLHSFSITILQAEMTAKEMNGALEYALGCHTVQRPIYHD